MAGSCWPLEWEIPVPKRGRSCSKSSLAHLTHTHTSIFQPIPTPASSLRRKSSWQESLGRKAKVSNRDSIFLNHRLPLNRNFQPLPGNSERIFEGYSKQKGCSAKWDSHRSVGIMSFIPTQNAFKWAFLWSS